MKRLYRLKPRVVLLKDFFVLDTETGTRHKDGSIKWGFPGRPENFQFGVIYGYAYIKIIYDLNDFIETLKEPRFYRRIIFGHNIIYDLNVVYGNIYDIDPKAVFNGKFISATNGTCRFACSMNIFGRLPLKNIGTMLGIEKPQLGDGNMYSPNGITDAEINRCVQDCIITYEGLIQIFQGAGDIKITGPSLAMSYFRRFHQPYDIDYNDNVLNFFDSYYGGRTEVFKIGKTSSTVVDVISMYAWVMKNAQFPNPKFLKVESDIPIDYFINQILPHYEGLAYCTVKHSNEKYYGFLPYKNDKGKLLFPSGRFSGCWNMPEIRFALGEGAIEIEKIDKIVYAERMESPFVTYVDDLFIKKATAVNEFEKSRVKHLLTDLYGKFAQKIDSDYIYLKDIDESYEMIREKQRLGLYVDLVMFSAIRNDAFLILKSEKTYTIPHQIPSFASYITSLARVHLLRQLLALHSRKVVYCDTDAVFFEIAAGVETDTRLGGWKIEKKIVTEVRALKNYSYHNGDYVLRERIKGVPERAVKNSDGIYEYETLMNTKEGLRRGLDPGVQTKRTKNITGKYDKRIVLENGETKCIEL